MEGDGLCFCWFFVGGGDGEVVLLMFIYVCGDGGVQWVGRVEGVWVFILFSFIFFSFIFFSFIFFSFIFFSFERNIMGLAFYISRGFGVLTTWVHGTGSWSDLTEEREQHGEHAAGAR